MTPARQSLEETLRQIAAIEKKLEDKSKKLVRSDTKDIKPPSSLVVSSNSKSATEGVKTKKFVFVCPKLKKVECCDFSLPHEFFRFSAKIKSKSDIQTIPVSIQTTKTDSNKSKSPIFTAPKLRQSPIIEFKLPQDYFEPSSQDSEETESPSLLSTKRKRAPLSPIINSKSFEDSSAKRPKTLFVNELKDLKTILRLEDNEIICLRGDRAISQYQRFERGESSHFIYILQEDGSLEGLIPFVLKNEASESCIHLAHYKCSPHFSTTPNWSHKSLLLLIEPRSIESITFVRNTSSGTLYLFYYLPSLLLTRLHSFHPSTKGLTSSLFHTPLSSVNCRIEKGGLLMKNECMVLWGRSSTDFFFWNIVNGKMVKVISRKDPSMKGLNSLETFCFSKNKEIIFMGD
nr:uncharacterized protein LOC121123001 [Lepeophtheirus salmonis]